MKVFKFRGIYNPGDIRLWVYGGLYQEYGKCYIIQGFQDHPQEMEWIGVEPKTVGLFTGLYDMNGKEIYEGDIVKFVFRFREGKKEVLLIVSLEVLSNKFDFFQNSINDFVRHEYRADEMEVVGNIYDNPELVEQAKESFK